jgi:hypothetical protein
MIMIIYHLGFVARFEGVPGEGYIDPIILGYMSSRNHYVAIVDSSPALETEVLGAKDDLFQCPEHQDVDSSPEDQDNSSVDADEVTGATVDADADDTDADGDGSSPIRTVIARLGFNKETPEVNYRTCGRFHQVATVFVDPKLHGRHSTKVINI